MSQTPMGHAESLRVGTVDFVSPDEIKVLLDIEAPESVALNAGGVRPFPRVSAYVLVLVDDGYLVGQIQWLTVERSEFPKRKGVQDLGLIDLPYPVRRMSLAPLGTLRRISGQDEGYLFRRGADALPSIGSPVLLPTQKQLLAIVESGDERPVQIGTSPLAGNARVCVDPDRIFGRHLAVLGNTGSGKSCSVAGIVRWSLEAARKKREGVTPGQPNARFIILDPNGEYSNSFAGDGDLTRARVYSVNADQADRRLGVPAWFWNSAEWAAFMQASMKTQRPLLKRALREVKAGRTAGTTISEPERKLELRRYLSSDLIAIQRDIRSGAIRSDETKFGFRLRAMRNDLDARKAAFQDCHLQAVQDAIDNALKATLQSFTKDGKVVEFYRAFTEAQVEPIQVALEASLGQLGGIIYEQGPDEDVPLPFRSIDLADHLQVLAAQESVTQFLDFFIARIRMFLSNPTIDGIIGDRANLALHEWLEAYVGADAAGNGELTIIDLSLVPSEIVHVVTAVIARVVFEALQRYRKLNGVTLPTVLVMEEAHTFVKRYKDDLENPDAAAVCCQVFERIAREGRKFGLGLVLSSQRPSELSPTVLSQCNTFLLHRISNDRDQEIVHKLVPDNLRGLLRELPSLPAQQAILLGWATEIPVLVHMSDLPKEHRPHSADPDFWHVWTGQDAAGNSVQRPVDWRAVANDWQGRATTATTPPRGQCDVGGEVPAAAVTVDDRERGQRQP